MRSPAHTFESVREASRNGKDYVRILTYGGVVRAKARRYGSKSLIDIDSFSGNYDLRRGAQEELWEAYLAYRKEKGLRAQVHSHFGKCSIIVIVHRDDEETWFQRILTALRDPSLVTLCDAAIELGPYLQERAEEFLLCTLVEADEPNDDGMIVRMVSPAWVELVRLIQANPRIMDTMDDRRFEELIAGAYKEAGYDVTLTPRSGDCGIDVIAERRGVGRVRIVDQAKRYARNRVVTAKDVRELGFVTLAGGDGTRGVVTTTSTFAPLIQSDKIVKPFLDSGRIELFDGAKLIDRLSKAYHRYTDG